MIYYPTTLERRILIDQIYTIHYYEYMNDFEFEGETHDFWEMLYVDRGNLLVQADDRTYELSAGDIVFHRPNEFHSLKSNSSTSPNLVVISFSSKSEDLTFFEQKHFHLLESEKRIISSILVYAEATFASDITDPHTNPMILRKQAPYGNQQILLSFIELLLISLVKTNSAVSYPDTVSLNTYRHKFYKLELSDQLSPIVEFLRVNVCETISVTDICQHFSISRSALQKLFHKELGCGIITFFNKLKLDYAKALLRERRMNVTEITTFLSYSSPQYFSKEFKKATGQSPTEYCRSIKKLSS